jgi:hypothetical protein
VPKAVTKLEVRGNFLSARNDETEYVWRLSDGSSLGGYDHGMTTSGLNPDGSDLMSVNPAEPTRFSVFKLCDDLQHIYDSTKDTC